MDVYKLAFGVAMRIFELTKSFPIEERFSLTDQIADHRAQFVRTCLRHGVSPGTREPSSFKLNDSEAEAAETQTWLEFASRCKYLEGSQAKELHEVYDRILGKLVRMIVHPLPWLLKPNRRT